MLFLSDDLPFRYSGKKAKEKGGAIKDSANLS
jgi:hypothetical protein